MSGVVCENLWECAEQRTITDHVCCFGNKGWVLCDTDSEVEICSKVVSWLGLSEGSQIEAFIPSYGAVIGCTLPLRRGCDLG